MTIRNKIAQKVYNYIYRNDDQNIFYKDIAEEIGICRQTVSKYVKWLIRRHIIKKDGYRLTILQN